MDAHLIVVGGKASKKKVALKLPMAIGRSREAELTIAHPMISRRHCELFETDGLLMIRDLDSLNGTLVEGQRIKESPLPPEREFTIGPLTFRAEYQYDGDLDALPEAVPATPAATPAEQPEAWSDSPQEESGATADQPAVELSFLEEIQGHQPEPVEEEQPPAATEEPPKDPEPEPEPEPASPPPAEPAPADEPPPPTDEEFDIDDFLDGLK